MKKLLSLLLSLALLITLSLPAFALPSSFSDVGDTHWALSDIETMVDLGVVNGMGDGTFQPESPVSAAHFATMLAKLCFSDQFYMTSSSAPQWWGEAMQTAQHNGLLENIPVGDSYTLRSDGIEYWNPTLAEAPMTRYEMAQVIANLLTALGIPQPSEAELAQARASIPDYIHPAYLDAVITSYALKCLQGMDSAGTFCGDLGMTRAQACRVMMNIISALEKQTQPDIDLPAEFGFSISQTELTLPLGDKLKLLSFISGVEDYTLTWHSENAAVATVDKTGVVQSRAPGTADITLQINVGGVIREAICTVTVPELKITLDHTRVTMNIGDSITLQPQVANLGSIDYSCVWSSSAPNVICVDPGKEGTFLAQTAGKAELICTIYCGSISRTVSCQVTVEDGESGVTSSTTDIPAQQDLDSIRAEILQLVNEARAAEGLPALTLRDDVCRAAQIRAEEIAIDYRSDHTRPDGRTCTTVLKDLNISYGYSGENIAAGYRTAQAVVDAWLASDGHRKNIMNSAYTAIGIGYEPGSDSSRYSHYWTQLFIS